MSTRRGLLATIPALALAATTLPKAAEAQGVTLSFGPPPPPVYARPVPPPRRGYVWAPGHWRWNGYRHVWVEGTWLRDRRGYHYSEPRWAENDGRWRYHPGVWQR